MYICVHGYEKYTALKESLIFLLAILRAASSDEKPIRALMVLLNEVKEAEGQPL